MTGRLNDTQNPSMMEAECQKIIIIRLIYQEGIFLSFGNFFRRLFHLVFTKNIHENSVGKTVWCSYDLNGIKEVYTISGHK